MGDDERKNDPTDEGNKARIEGDWGKAGEQASKSWGNRPDEPPADAPAGNAEQLERMKEGYGTGKDDADPQGRDGGTAPPPPVR